MRRHRRGETRPRLSVRRRRKEASRHQLALDMHGWVAVGSYSIRPTAGEFGASTLLEGFRRGGYSVEDVDGAVAEVNTGYAIFPPLPSASFRPSRNSPFLSSVLRPRLDAIRGRTHRRVDPKHLSIANLTARQVPSPTGDVVLSCWCLARRAEGKTLSSRGVSLSIRCMSASLGPRILAP